MSFTLFRISEHRFPLDEPRDAKAFNGARCGHQQGDDHRHISQAAQVPRGGKGMKSLPEPTYFQNRDGVRKVGVVAHVGDIVRGEQHYTQHKEHGNGGDDEVNGIRTFVNDQVSYIEMVDFGSE